MFSQLAVEKVEKFYKGCIEWLPAISKPMWDRFETAKVAMQKTHTSHSISAIPNHHKKAILAQTEKKKKRSSR